MKPTPEDLFRSNQYRAAFPIGCNCTKRFTQEMTDAMGRGIKRGMTMVEAAGHLRQGPGGNIFVEGDRDFSASFPAALPKICCRNSITAVEIFHFGERGEPADEPDNHAHAGPSLDFAGYPPELAMFAEPEPAAEMAKRFDPPQVEFDPLRQVTLLIEPGLTDFPLPIVWDIGDELRVYAV